MINIRTLDVLLRSFDGDTSAARPPAPVGAVGAIAEIGARLAPSRAALVPQLLEDAGPAAMPVARGGRSASQANASATSTAAGARRAASAGTALSGTDGEALTASMETTLDASAPLRLSGAARLVGDLIRETAARNEEAAVRSAAPLLVSPPTGAEPLAHALSAAIGNSGLFYESHLAQWALQERSQAALASEPQAAWTHGVAADGVQTGLAATDATAPPVLQHGNVHTDAALPLIRHQLHALETRQVAWSGDVWPGQPAQLHIAQDEQGDASAAAPAWRTHLTLELPSLGKLDVTLALQGNSLRLQVRAESTGSAQALRLSRQTLLAAMEQRSLAITGLSIGHERDE